MMSIHLERDKCADEPLYARATCRYKIVLLWEINAWSLSLVKHRQKHSFVWRVFCKYEVNCKTKPSDIATKRTTMTLLLLCVDDSCARNDLWQDIKGNNALKADWQHQRRGTNAIYCRRRHIIILCSHIHRLNTKWITTGRAGYDKKIMYSREHLSRGIHDTIQ